MTCIAFEGTKKIASGELSDVAVKAQKAAQSRQAPVLIFDEQTSELIEVDFRGTARDVLRRLDTRPPAQLVDVNDQPRKPGRPKLGVVAREVTLLPRHWEWLNVQPGGASVALRKLVDEARKIHRNTDRVRKAKEAAYKFLSAMAGNEPGFEEATRALFANDPARFTEHSRNWPPDVRDHASRLANRVFQEAHNE